MSATTDPIELILSRLQNVKRNGTGASGACPVLDCTYRLIVNRGDDGRALVSCKGGHRADDVVATLGLKLSDLFVPNGREKGEGARHTPPNNTATAQHPGLTIAQYAGAKKLDPDRLRNWGVTDTKYLNQPAIRISYLDTTGNELPPATGSCWTRARTTIASAGGRAARPLPTGNSGSWSRGSEATSS